MTRGARKTIARAVGATGAVVVGTFAWFVHAPFLGMIVAVVVWTWACRYIMDPWVDQKGKDGR